MTMMTVTRALNELKLLDKRITDTVNGSKFVSCAKRSSKKVDQLCTKEEFEQNAKSNYQSILDLIKRRNEIKSKIVNSNAKTIIEVAGVEMTVAEAIERKTAIIYEKMLLNHMKVHFNKSVANMNKNNEKVEEQLNVLLVTLVGKDGKNSSAEGVKEISDKYKADNEWELVNPLKLEEKIKTLEESIDGFESEVDFVLSESNSITKIEVD